MSSILPGHPAHWARSLSGAATTVMVTAGLLASTPLTPMARVPTRVVPQRLSSLVSDIPSTVLTLEAGVVGAQHQIHLTPRELRGSPCAAPNLCQPVDYTALPGIRRIDSGAAATQRAIDRVRVGDPVTLFGYSEGSQVIYTLLRDWASNPTSAPDPTRVSWLSIGNPGNQYGGIFSQLGIHTERHLPTASPYHGVEVIRQYDGWADWPTNSWNLLADLNAMIGMTIVHTDYMKVNLDSPDNRTFTPADPDGSPGNVTYVWVPTPTLPLLAFAGPLKPALDKVLRPIIESAYRRPVALPGSASAIAHAPGAASRTTATIVRTTAARQASSVTAARAKA